MVGLSSKLRKCRTGISATTLTFCPAPPPPPPQLCPTFYVYPAVHFTLLSRALLLNPHFGSNLCPTLALPVIYTSDNGYHFGQFSLGADKRQAYEHDIRVPMLVRGPGVPVNVTLEDIVLNIDLAPTIVELAMQTNETSSKMDGRSFMSLFPGNAPSNTLDAPWRSDFLVSYNGDGDTVSGLYERERNKYSADHPPDSLNNTYNCIRTIAVNVSSEIVIPSVVSTTIGSTGANTLYCQFEDDKSFVEFYDLSMDPWQLHNRASMLTTEDHLAYAKRLSELKACTGEDCRVIPSA